MHSNAFVITHRLLKQFKVKHTLTGLKQTLEEHPDYPSLLSISDCLDGFSIANQAFKIEKCNFTKLSYPFIAHITSQGGNFILVTSYQDGKIALYNEKNHYSELLEEQFLEMWSGIVLYAEANKSSREPKYYNNLFREILRYQVSVIVILLMFVGILFFRENSFKDSANYIFLLTNSIGIFLSGLLILKTMDNTNPMLERVCSIGKKNGCDAVLKSDASRLTSWLSWSEVGLLYFCGLIVFVLCLKDSRFIISYISLLALPYTFYSISYQFRKKSWCVLCCGVQAVLWLNFAIAYLFGLFSEQPKFLAGYNLSMILQIIFTYIVLFTVWYLLKPFFEKYIQYFPLKQQLQRFKFNSAVFEQLLKGGQKYNIPSDVTPIILGNPLANRTITMVSNPLCGPCSSAHHTVDGWLKDNNNLKIKVIFACTEFDGEEKKSIIRHIISLANSGDAELAKEAINNWFLLNKGYKEWAKIFPTEIDHDAEQIMLMHRKWCELNSIESTPTVLIDDYKLPAYYSLDELKHLMD